MSHVLNVLWTPSKQLRVWKCQRRARRQRSPRSRLLLLAACIPLVSLNEGPGKLEKNVKTQIFTFIYLFFGLVAANKRLHFGRINTWEVILQMVQPDP